MEPGQSVRDLVLIATGLRLHGERDVGLGPLDAGERESRPLGAQRVTRVRVPQLGHGSDVPRVKSFDLATRRAARHRDVGDALRGRVTRIQQGQSVRDRATEQPEVAHVPDVRFGGGLEDERDGGCTILGLNLDRLAGHVFGQLGG